MPAQEVDKSLWVTVIIRPSIKQFAVEILNVELQIKIFECLCAGGRGIGNNE